MNADQLRAAQAPLKERYRNEPKSAVVTFRVQGRIGPDVTCHVETWSGLAEAGLHPAAGGDGSKACSGDMLLEALVACAGVTLNAVATAMGITIHDGTITAEGEGDFRGTLGVSKEAPVGFIAIRLHFDLDTDADEDKVAKLVELAERYCVVYQTLSQSPQMSASYAKRG